MMKAKAQKAFNELKAMNVPVFERDDIEYFGISGEDGDYRIDYYNTDCESADFGIDNTVNDILIKNNLFAEWESPASVTVYDSWYL